MRSNMNPEEFFDKMKKKPGLQDILDNFEEYSVEDFKNTNQPKWVRDVLEKKKQREIQTGKRNLPSMEEMDLSIYKKPSDQIINPEYDCYFYSGGPTEVETYSFTGMIRTSFSISDNQYFLIMENGNVKISHNLIKITEVGLRKVLQNSSFQKKLTVQDYIIFVSEMKGNSEKIENSENEINNTNEKDYGFFRIRKH